MAILAAVARIALASLLDPGWSQSNRQVYWLEFLALIAFGLSWIAQDRASGLLLLDARDRSDVALTRVQEEDAERMD